MPKFNSWRTCIALSLLTGALAACGGSSGDSSTGTGSSNTATSTNKTEATSTSSGNSTDADVRFAP